MANFKELGTHMVDDVLSGATGPLGALFGDKHASSSLSFPLNVEGLGQKHFIRFNVVDFLGNRFATDAIKGTTSADSNVVGDLIGGAVGAAVGGGLGGALLGNIAGNIADQSGISTAIGSIADAGQDLIGTTVGTIAGTAQEIGGGIIGAVEGGVSSAISGGVGAISGLFEADPVAAGGFNQLTGGLGDTQIPSGSLEDIQAAMEDKQAQSLEMLNKPLPDSTLLGKVKAEWNKGREATEATFTKLLSAGEDIGKSLATNVVAMGDALKGIGEEGGEDLSRTEGGASQSVADIMLYLPFNVQETYSVGWTNSKLGAFDALKQAAGPAGASLDWAKFKSFMGDVVADSGAAYQKVENYIKSVGLEGYVGRELVGKLAGARLNNEAIALEPLKGGFAGKAKNPPIAVDPHFTVHFEGAVNARTFTFDFKMNPRNSSEAVAIATICRTFKMYAAPPAKTLNYRFWGYPAYFEIEYWNSNLTHKIKNCALTSIAINHTGTGDNHTFYDGYPLQTDLSLQFQETELLTREDFQSGDGGGY